MKNLKNHAADIEHLLKTMDLEHLAPAEQEQMLLTLSDVVFQGSLVRFVEHMSEGARAEFAVLCENRIDPEAISNFIEKNVPNADLLVKETISELAKDMKALNIPVSN